MLGCGQNRCWWQVKALQGAGIPRTAESPWQGDWELVPPDSPFGQPSPEGTCSQISPDWPSLQHAPLIKPVPILLAGCVPESPRSVGWIQPTPCARNRSGRKLSWCYSDFYQQRLFLTAADIPLA